MLGAGPVGAASHARRSAIKCLSRFIRARLHPQSQEQSKSLPLTPPSPMSAPRIVTTAPATNKKTRTATGHATPSPTRAAITSFNPSEPRPSP